VINQQNNVETGRKYNADYFPSTKEAAQKDPMNVLDTIIEDIEEKRINSSTRESIESVYDLSKLISNRHSAIFFPPSFPDGEDQFLDMFEFSIGNVTDQEEKPFQKFNITSKQASAWLKR